MNTAKSSTAGAGTQTSALSFGGAPGTGPTGNVDSGSAESYNGATWTEVANLNSPKRSNAGFGASNQSALAFGGYRNDPAGAMNLTELWNGSNWTEVNNLNTARYGGMASFGTTSAGITAGGTSVTAVTELWNGTNWTEVNDLNTARRGMGGAGISTSGLAFGGAAPSPPGQRTTEKWNGTNWTSVNDLNTGKDFIAGAGTSSTAVLCIGGRSVPGGQLAETELYNGTNWAEQNDLNTARNALAGCGATPAALAFGGDTPGATGATESWNILTPTRTINTN